MKSVVFLQSFTRLSEKSDFFQKCKLKFHHRKMYRTLILENISTFFGKRTQFDGVLVKTWAYYHVFQKILPSSMRRCSVFCSYATDNRLSEAFWSFFQSQLHLEIDIFFWKRLLKIKVNMSSTVEKAIFTFTGTINRKITKQIFLWDLSISNNHLHDQVDIPKHFQ